MPCVSFFSILYSLVTSRAIFFQIFREGSRHRHEHTVVGWGTWIAIVFGGWVISFIVGEAIPFFSDMLSLISSLFDSWYALCSSQPSNRLDPLSSDRKLMRSFPGGAGSATSCGPWRGSR